ncbi:hypothetical protein [Halobacillus sp. BAB-2008]|nr:hypothetical protein [Halobacillus sp. BAB-2008]
MQKCQRIRTARYSCQHHLVRLYQLMFRDECTNIAIHDMYLLSVISI